MKTKNYSIRFDQDQFNTAMTHTNFEKPQQLIDFLLDRYCNTICNTNAPTTEPTCITNTLPHTKTPKSIADYIHEKRELESEDQFIIWKQTIENNTSLTPKQKLLILNT